MGQHAHFLCAHEPPLEVSIGIVLVVHKQELVVVVVVPIMIYSTSLLVLGASGNG